MAAAQLWFPLLSDLFVNLSAGWFGAVFVVSTKSRLQSRHDVGLLITNLLFAILALLIAYLFKKALL